MAVLHQYTDDGAVDRHRVGVGALTSFDDHGVVVDIHIATVYEDVVTLVYIERIAAGSLHA